MATLRKHQSFKVTLFERNHRKRPNRHRSRGLSPLGDAPRFQDPAFSRKGWKHRKIRTKLAKQGQRTSRKSG